MTTCSTLSGSLRRKAAGSAPVASVAVTTTTTLRAAAFKTNYQSTNVDTQTYLFLDDVVVQPNSPAGFPSTWGSAPAADYEMDPEVTTDPAYTQDLMDGLRDFTISVWMQTDAVHANGLNTFLSGAVSDDEHNNLLINYDAPRGGFWEFYISVNGEGMQAAFEDDTIEDNDWHHYVFMREGPTARLYIDGEQIGDDEEIITEPLDFAADGLYLGQEQDDLGDAFDTNQSWEGKMDNFRVYDRALSDSEIETLAEEPYSN